MVWTGWVSRTNLQGFNEVSKKSCILLSKEVLKERLEKSIEEINKVT